ncbi:hypothetical protein NHX12_031587, partial [Muraenolepis orangiensis]
PHGAVRLLACSNGAGPFPRPPPYTPASRVDTKRHINTRSKRSKQRTSCLLF